MKETTNTSNIIEIIQSCLNDLSYDDLIILQYYFDAQTQLKRQLSMEFFDKLSPIATGIANACITIKNHSDEESTYYNFIQYYKDIPSKLHPVSDTLFEIDDIDSSTHFFNTYITKSATPNNSQMLFTDIKKIINDRITALQYEQTCDIDGRALLGQLQPIDKIAAELHKGWAK